MRYTKATNYALHIMKYIISRNGNDNISLKPIAMYMNISPSYLSKILTQLVKADLIQSAPGMNGGYHLRKSKTDISFYDIIQAIEGSSAMFTCEMSDKENCKIEIVMTEAESIMITYLKQKKLYEIG